MQSIRVLIADDHPVYRDGLRVLLDSLPQAEVVGEAQIPMIGGQGGLGHADGFQRDGVNQLGTQHRIPLTHGSR